MGNTQGVWILYVIVLSLKFLIADKQMTAAGRQWTVKETVEISQPRNFKNALTLKWNSK